MDAVALLRADHNRVKGMFTRFEKATTDTRLPDATELVGAIINELDVHTTIEEEVFYPAVRELTDQLAEVVDEGIQEHHLVKVLIDEIAAVEADSRGQNEPIRRRPHPNGQASTDPGPVVPKPRRAGGKRRHLREALSGAGLDGLDPRRPSLLLPETWPVRNSDRHRGR
jgi:hypothetical protein